jgi:hypothetical protein
MKSLCQASGSVGIEVIEFSSEVRRPDQASLHPFGMWNRADNLGHAIDTKEGRGELSAEFELETTEVG